MGREAVSPGTRGSRRVPPASRARRRLRSLVAGLSVVLCVGADLAVAGDGDTRHKVEFPEMMRRHMLVNMRDHLAALAEIQQALSSGAFDQAAEIAEKRIGMSSLQSHGAAHMAAFMPSPMQEIGTEMHRAASRFAVVSQQAAVDGDLKRAIGGLAEVTRQCVACHASYRVH